MNNKKIMINIFQHMNSKEYRNDKLKRLEQVREEVIKKQPETVFEYNVILNSIFGRHRIESRNRVNKILIKKIEENKKI